MTHNSGLHRARFCILIFLVSVGTALVFHQPKSVVAHGGGLDRYGCHRDTKAGSYHCHRGPCQGKTFRDQAEMLKASCASGK
jgi:hypothetical protein